MKLKDLFHTAASDKCHQMQPMPPCREGWTEPKRVAEKQVGCFSHLLLSKYISSIYPSLIPRSL